MIDLKVGQKWQDASGWVRHIKNVSGGRVTYSFTMGDNENPRMGTGSPEDFREDTLLEDGVTFTREEAIWLKRMLAGYSVGKVGQSVLDKLGAVVMLLMFVMIGCNQDSPSKPTDSRDYYAARREYVATHHCLLTHRYESETLWDTAKDEIVKDTALNTYKCDGVDREIYVRDKATETK